MCLVYNTSRAELEKVEELRVLNGHNLLVNFLKGKKDESSMMVSSYEVVAEQYLVEIQSIPLGGSALGAGGRFFSQVLKPSSAILWIESFLWAECGHITNH